MLELIHRDGKKEGDFIINGERYTRTPQPVYDSQFVYAESGILRVNDGVEAFEVDFTGNLPVFTEPYPIDPSDLEKRAKNIQETY